jgi:precorrin-6Y C5,15-methyltransferase (decarboxylating)
VVGYDGGTLPVEAQELLAKASLVVGGVRALSQVRLPVGVPTAVLSETPSAVDRIVGHGGEVVVLAFGDPGLFGVLRGLRQRGVRPRVLPALSSVALAFARAGMPWDDAAVVNAYQKDLRPVANACRALPKVAVLTAPGVGPAELGAALDGWHRTLLVAERLGELDERVTRCQPAEAASRGWVDPNVVLVLDETRTDAGPQWTNQVAAPPPGWGWPEDRFAHRERTVTRREVRVLALGLLRPTLGTLVWDVGAGCGSVAVECAALRAAVIAVEPDPEACFLIRRNAAAFRVDVRVAQARAPEAFEGLPDPDAVFLGGGGLPALEGVLARRPATVVVSFAAVDWVGSARWMLSAAGYQVDGVQVATSRLAELPGGSVRLAAQNPVFLVSGRLP